MTMRLSLTFGRKKLRLTVLLMLLLAAASPAMAGEHLLRPAGTMQASATQTPIRSRAALEAYLQHAVSAGAKTPFDRFSPGAKLRFLGGLEFNERGLSNFKVDDLSEELSADEIRRVLALFGREETAALIAPSPKPRGTAGTSKMPAVLSDVERRFNEFYVASIHPTKNETDLEAAHRYRRMFAALFPEDGDIEALKRLDAHDLRLVFRAALTAAFLDAELAHVLSMASTLRELETRGEASDREVENVYERLLAARGFEQARQFIAAHPQVKLPPQPNLRDTIVLPGQATVWMADADGNGMSRTVVDLDPVQILVMAGCHFAKDAAREIAADAELGPVFRQHARWLSLPPGHESFDAIREWNQTFPDAPMQMLYDRAEWPMFEHWAMPTFYIFRGGRIIDSVVGWRSPEQQGALRDALQRAGLLQASANTTDKR